MTKLKLTPQWAETTILWDQSTLCATQSVQLFVSEEGSRGLTNKYSPRITKTVQLIFVYWRDPGEQNKELDRTGQTIHVLFRNLPDIHRYCACTSVDPLRGKLPYLKWIKSVQGFTTLLGKTNKTTPEGISLQVTQEAPVARRPAPSLGNKMNER